MNALAAVEYDADNLYLYVRVHLPDRPLQNTNGPSDPFWNGDMVEFRLASDPALSHPLPFANDRRIALLEPDLSSPPLAEHDRRKDYVHIAYGGSLQAGQTLNPPGARQALTNRREGCLLEAVIPWTALNAPGGKNPYFSRPADERAPRRPLGIQRHVHRNGRRSMTPTRAASASARRSNGARSNSAPRVIFPPATARWTTPSPPTRPHRRR
ncbi:MAG: hypothetical protein WDO13_08085 [Verrucomicrobiota bacterium]